MARPSGKKPAVGSMFTGENRKQALERVDGRQRASLGRLSEESLTADSLGWERPVHGHIRCRNMRGPRCGHAANCMDGPGIRVTRFPDRAGRMAWRLVEGSRNQQPFTGLECAQQAMVRGRDPLHGTVVV